MSRCDCGTRCTCVITAGDGIAVDGNGSTSAPYVISTSGDGTVSCDEVRPCISSGPGLDYDPATGVMGARPSTDAGNTLAIGSDGGLLVPPGAATALQVNDTPSVDLSLAGDGSAGAPYQVSAAVRLDATPPGGGTNLLHSNADGLYVECADVRGCLSEGDGIDYDPATGVISARFSTDAGNAVSFGSDGGLMVTPGAVSCDDVRPCLSEGPGIDYDPATGTIAAKPSTAAGNTLTIGSDGGLLVPPGAATALQVNDTPSVDLSLAGDGSAGAPYQVSAAVRLDATPPGGGTNLLHSNADGLYVECADVRGCLSEGDGIDYDPATGTISARPSTDAGNTVTIGSDGGLLVPPGGGAAPATGCGLTGDGSAGAPLAAAVSAWPYPCDVNAEAGLVYCDDSGVLRGEPRARYDFQQQHIPSDFTNPTVPSGIDVVVLTRNFTITNPDPCRPARVMVEQEVDIDFFLPAGASAAGGIGTDEMQFFYNRSASTTNNIHQQSTKVYNMGTPLPPGGSATITMDVTMGRGTNGATYDRIQTFLRAFIFIL
ncbi:hypothetical protein F5972_08045 [Microbispora cellulosiformans]|uniref:Uncharacterized protein n=1 Tax=Microbispora cellulosiformans TaxID=2614688 RepID=A0A5J5K730_9ACTN|nr:hypothetical protein [Microbispora cellulosiformans]KAA9379598.1 hypothetical protein F5972_08045 [Microbispora cellulosiformans]